MSETGPKTFRELQRARAKDGSYRRRRQVDYPTVGEQLDALWKTIVSLAHGGTIPADARAVMDAVAAVKAKHPKPSTSRSGKSKA